MGGGCVPTVLLVYRLVDPSSILLALEPVVLCVINQLYKENTDHAVANLKQNSALSEYFCYYAKYSKV
jgi:hypothetical protein